MSPRDFKPQTSRPVTQRIGTSVNEQHVSPLDPLSGYWVMSGYCIVAEQHRAGRLLRQSQAVVKDLVIVPDGVRNNDVNGAAVFHTRCSEERLQRWG